MNIFRNKFDFFKPVSIGPLVTFRIAFGLLMVASLARFWWSGWIEELYIKPSFHFTYFGFEWVEPLPGLGMYLLYAVLILSAFLITLGFFYRVATIVFFIGFTYAELIDATTYLNHYYFISLVSFLLIWIPANRSRSLDVRFNRVGKVDNVPAWTVGIIRFQLAIVYVFAGLAKLNYDWLIEAQPMRTWLPAKSHLPVVGALFYKSWVAYFFSWFGAIYDLFIVFFLLNKKTRKWAYAMVVIFHGATALLFPPIGMFPYVMIACTLIFFPGSVPAGKISYPLQSAFRKKLIAGAIVVYAIFQLVVPLRFLAYPGRLFWHEQGYRFSWRVMLMEKAGAAYFTVKEQGTTRQFEVNNAEFLTPLQEKMMSTQPDMIVKYARYLAKVFEDRGVKKPAVSGEVYVTLNGERSTLFIDSTVNLAAQKPGWQRYNWVLPY